LSEPRDLPLAFVQFALHQQHGIMDEDVLGVALPVYAEREADESGQ
jgi:hypothetical protein